MIENVEFLRIEINAAFDIANEGIVRPGIPKTCYAIEEFTCAPIACGMFKVLFAAKILRLRWIAGGHHVPAGPAAANVIERGEFARNMVRVIVGRRGGGYQPNMLSQYSESGKQRQRIERGHCRAAFQGFEWHVQDGEMIGHEKGVKFSSLQRLCKARQMPKIEIRVRVGARITPPSRMDSDRAHECAEVQATLVRHRT